MNNKILMGLPLAFAGIAAASFIPGKNKFEPATEKVGINSNDPSNKFSYEPHANSVDFEDMNPAVNPTVDFFEYVNGKWIDRTPIPSTESSWGKFNVLSDNNNKVLHQILESAS